jgi:hypothetical protein
MIPYFGEAYNEVKREWEPVFKDRQASNNSFEEEYAIADMGLPVQLNEGENISFDGVTQLHASRIAHSHYAQGIIITKIAIADGKYINLAKDAATRMGSKFARLKNVVAANVLNNAFSSSYLGGDGVSLCSTAHPIVGGATVSNRMSVDAPFGEAAIEQMDLDIRNYKDNRGLKDIHSLKSLVIPKELAIEAMRLFGASGRPGEMSNDINVIPKLVPGGVHVLNSLTDLNAFFALTDCPKGLVHYERQAPAFSSDVVFDNMNHKFAMDERYSFGWHEFRGIHGSDGE